MFLVAREQRSQATVRIPPQVRPSGLTYVRYFW